MKFSVASALSLSLAAFSFAAELPLYQPDQLKSDIALIRSALEEGHPGLYRYTPRSELTGAWEQAGETLNRPMNALEFYRAVGPVLALIKDGHLGWSVSSDLQHYLDNVPVLPFGVRMVRKTLTVFRDLSDSKPSLVGLEIVSVNGIAVARLVEDVMSRQMADGDVVSSRVRGVAAGFARELVKTCNLGPPYEVMFHNPMSGRTETHRFDGTPWPQLVKDWRAHWPNDIEVRTDRPVSELEFLDSDRIARMRIPSFGGSEADAKSRDLRSFFANSFRELAGKKTRALIIDVRDNGGGEDEAGQILASYLIDKPFRYYRDLIVKGTTFKFLEHVTTPDPIPAEMISRGSDGQLHFTGHPNLGVKTPREPGFRGALFILMNGGSFSTTAEFLSNVRSKCAAKFIGEESAGAFGGNNSGFEPTITLPATRLLLRIPLLAYYVDVSAKYPIRRGILPDQTVEYSTEEMLARSDKELELALSLARSSLPES